MSDKPVNEAAAVDVRCRHERDLTAAHQRIDELERSQVGLHAATVEACVRAIEAEQLTEALDNEGDKGYRQAINDAIRALARLASPLGSGVPALDPVMVAVPRDLFAEIEREGMSGGWLADSPLAARIRSLTSQPGGTPPAPVPTVCATWCGCSYKDVFIGTDEYARMRDGKCFCTPACRDAQRPLHPATPGER